MSDRAGEADFPIPFRRTLERERNSQASHDALADELQDALDREQVLQQEKRVLLQEKHDIAQRHAMLAQEFEHRLIVLQRTYAPASLQALA